MRPASPAGSSPGVHLCWNLTHVIPDWCISPGCPRSCVCPPSSKPPPTTPPATGGGGVVGAGVRVGAGVFPLGAVVIITVGGGAVVGGGPTCTATEPRSETCAPTIAPCTVYSPSLSGCQTSGVPSPVVCVSAAPLAPVTVHCMTSVLGMDDAALALNSLIAVSRPESLPAAIRLLITIPPM